MNTSRTQRSEKPVFIVEDLHWTDPTTLELLNLVIEQIPTTSILTVLTCRPHFQPAWHHRSYLTEMTLNRLSHAQVEQIVNRLTDGKALPHEVVQQIIEKTDGVPLFIEEMTKAILESGHLKEVDGHYALTGPFSTFTIPATLQDSLMARLDRLVTAKGVAQIGATIGRQFVYDLLQAVSQLDASTLQRELGRLVEAEIVHQRGLPPQSTYVFKHALIQDAAAQSLLKSTRQQYHQRIAHVLEAQFPAIVDQQPELLAHHYTEAGFVTQAIPYWQQSGQRAIQRSAHTEAISHLAKGLEVLKALPDTPERTQHELTLQLTLAVSLMATQGYSAPEVERVYARARELCGQVGETPQLFPVLHGLWRYYLVRADFQTARQLVEQFLSLAQRTHDPTLLVEPHRALGTTLLWLGELTAARPHLAQAVALYNPQQRRAHTVLYGQDPAVASLAHAALALWCLGYPNQALQTSHEALTRAREPAHPFTLAYALCFAAEVHQLCREVQAAHERAEAEIALCTEQGFAFYLTRTTILRGWALAKQGQWEEGIGQMRQGLIAYRGMGAEQIRPYCLGLLAETYRDAGQTEEGLAVLAEALALVNHTGERYWEAEIYRLKGELLLQQAVPDAPQAETSFRQALDVARSQQAESLELRAAMSLSRLWQRQGKRTAAHELLAPVYGWFTEGFDTADLTDAKALLDALA